MHGRKRFLIAFGLLSALLVGCAPPSRGPGPPSAGDTAGSAFDPATAGTIQGQVIWTGAEPVIPSFHSWSDIAPDGTSAKRQVQPNPNAPRIDPATRGVADAVVFLRGVSIEHARPWDHPPVEVEQSQYQFHVHQGPGETHVGFVRRHGPVALVSRDTVFYSLHASGAAYFTLTAPDPDQVRTRRLDEPGLVELTSAAGYFWMRAYLFVAEHPYYTRTDATGHFTLPQVPPGTYEVVCWLPSWREAQHERDPETALFVRLHFRAPVERSQSLHPGPGETSTVRFSLSNADF